MEKSLDSINFGKPQDLHITKASQKHIFQRHINPHTHTETSKLHPQLHQTVTLLNFIEHHFANLSPIETETPQLTTQRKVFKKKFDFSVGTEGELFLTCVLDFHHNSNKIILATCYPVGPPIFPCPLTPVKTLLSIV